MENIERLIKEKNLINAGDVIGIGVSGGKDSMALVHYLSGLQEKFDFELVAITVDHSLREESGEDASFVLSYCKRLGLRAYKFKVDPKKIAEAQNISLEEAARDARYAVFNAVLKKGICDKIALAHHQADQAETVLMRLLRGTGVTGACGMGYIRDNVFIRPMLETSQKAIKKYIFENEIEIREDSTNKDNEISRNFLRNEIFPQLEERWPGATERLCNFAKCCREDEEYIQSQINSDAVLYGDKTARVPIFYMLCSTPLATRLLLNVFKNIGINKDIESKHLKMICELARGETSKKINLPYDITCIKEYDYIAIINKFEPKPTSVYAFKTGEFDATNYGTVITKRIKKEDFDGQGLVIDYKQVPKGAYWRYRKEGDFIVKFGGGSVKLKKFFIDKKVPARLRDFVPVLAFEDEVYVVAGVDISDKVKITDETQNAYQIKIKK